MSTKDIKKGDKFRHKGEEWICTSNDGFIFMADCISNPIFAEMMIVGGEEELEEHLCDLILTLLNLRHQNN